MLQCYFQILGVGGKQKPELRLEELLKLEIEGSVITVVELHGGSIENE